MHTQVLSDFHAKIHFLPLVLRQLPRVFITNIRDVRKIMLFLLIWKRHISSSVSISIPSKPGEGQPCMYLRIHWGSQDRCGFALAHSWPSAQL